MVAGLDGTAVVGGRVGPLLEGSCAVLMLVQPGVVLVVSHGRRCSMVRWCCSASLSPPDDARTTGVDKVVEALNEMPD